MGASLLVVSKRAALAGTVSKYTHVLVLDEGVLIEADTAALVLWSPEDRDRMRGFAQAVAERPWAELDEVGGTSSLTLGAVVAGAAKLDVYWDFCAYFRTGTLLQRALELVEPSQLEWRATEPVPRSGATYQMPPVIAPRVPGWLRRSDGGATEWLKRTKWEWTARALAGVFERQGKVERRERIVGVLGVFDVRNPGMIGNVGKLLEHMSSGGQSTMGVSMHAQVTEAARAYKGLQAVVPLAKYARPSDVWYALKALPRAGREVRSFGEGVSEDPLVATAAKRAFHGLHWGYLLQAVMDIRAVRRLLVDTEPQALVLASDAHHYSRLMVAVARQLGIQTFVLQHGAPAQAHFYTPVVADMMLAWGSWCREWFVARGTPEGRVQDVGFVRARERREFRPADGKVTRLLFAAQPISDHITAELLNMVRGALMADKGLALVVRPHPGEGRRTSLEYLVASWPADVQERCSFSPPGQSLANDLQGTDVVVTGQSTVGIDALADGVPVCLLVHPAVSEPIPFREFRCVVEVGNSDDLLRGLAELADQGFRDQLSAAASEFLEAYVGRSGEEALAAATRCVLQVASPVEGDP